MSKITKNCVTSFMDDPLSLRREEDEEEEEEEEFEFVEPMVFDLVRALGAKPGESEANYLMVIPLNGDHIAFSPEYEIVYGYHQV